MKKSKIVAVFNSITVLKNAKEESNVKFRYALNKNLSIIEPEIKILQEIEKEQAEILKAFNDERDEYIKKNGKLNEFGQSYLPLKDQASIEAFNTFLSDLKERNKEALEKFEKEDADYRKMLEETDAETEVKFYKMSMDVCPDWTTKPQYAGSVDVLIDEGIIDEIN